jgi:hypothetical protein
MKTCDLSQVKKELRTIYEAVKGTSKRADEGVGLSFQIR